MKSLPLPVCVALVLLSIGTGALFAQGKDLLATLRGPKNDDWSADVRSTLADHATRQSQAHDFFEKVDFTTAEGKNSVQRVEAESTTLTMHMSRTLVNLGTIEAMQNARIIEQNKKLIAQNQRILELLERQTKNTRP